MNKIADADELEYELRRLLAASREEYPSRSRMANELDRLASRLVTAKKKGEVIESKSWKHKSSGATASLYGAVPWSGADGDEKSDWELETTGYTISWDDGTIGIGRQPFKTKAEAQAHLDKMVEKGLVDKA